MSSALGMQAGAATLENSMEVPQKTKSRTTLRPSNCTTRYLSRGYKNADSKEIAALSTIAKLWEEPKCPSTDEWIKKTWGVCVCVCVCVYTHIYHKDMRP